MTFHRKLDAMVDKNNSLLCVGLDSDMRKIPAHLRNGQNTQFIFNKTIIDATHDLVCAYKPNSAFYEARGDRGIAELKRTCDYLHEKYPDIGIILDAKRADIGSTNEGYVEFAFDWLGVDAITLHPYLGREAIQPFLDRKEKGSIILCRTSNPGAGEFQDLSVDSGDQSVKLYQHVAQKIAEEWNVNGNCGLVVGATYPAELEIVRRIVGDMTILVPGVGVQGGNLEKAVKAGVNSKGGGMIINASRSIIFADDPLMAARQLRGKINSFRSDIYA